MCMDGVGWGGGAYKRQFTVRELEHKICRRCNDPGGGYFLLRG